jgi:hypothetical protein
MNVSRKDTSHVRKKNNFTNMNSVLQEFSKTDSLTRINFQGGRKITDFAKR